MTYRALLVCVWCSAIHGREAANYMTIFSHLSLYPANAAQILESRKRTFRQWARGTTLEEYLERDEINDRREAARDGRFVTW